LARYFAQHKAVIDGLTPCVDRLQAGKAVPFQKILGFLFTHIERLGREYISIPKQSAIRNVVFQEGNRGKASDVPLKTVVKTLNPFPRVNNTRFTGIGLRIPIIDSSEQEGQGRATICGTRP
jgi:hypothetical protein